MIGRKLLAFLVAAAWLAPSTAVVALALHVALDHAPASPAHGLADLAEHGHAHNGDAGEHGHEVTVPTEAAVRRLLADGAVAVSAAGFVAEFASPVVLVVTAPPAPPPRPAGPPLLALLSILRV